MASKRRLRRRSCGSKQRHPSIAQAYAHALSLRKKTGEVVRPYRCDFCGGFHVGHFARRS